jgi:hypothetical protein
VPVPADIRQRVRADYAELGLDEAQPVLKVPLHIYRINEMLQINEVVTGIGAAATAPVGGNAMMAVQDTNKLGNE